MKNILESGETFEAYARIDCCYWMIKEMHNRLSKPRSGIEIMIDEATGFTAAETKVTAETIISLLEEIISSKKEIEADYSGDEKMLNEIKTLMQ